MASPRLGLVLEDKLFEFSCSFCGLLSLNTWSRYVATDNDYKTVDPIANLATKFSEPLIDLY